MRDGGRLGELAKGMTIGVVTATGLVAWWSGILFSLDHLVLTVLGLVVGAGLCVIAARLRL
jgi:hypothetical protein